MDKKIDLTDKGDFSSNFIITIGDLYNSEFSSEDYENFVGSFDSKEPFKHHKYFSANVFKRYSRFSDDNVTFPWRPVDFTLTRKNRNRIFNDQRIGRNPKDIFSMK